MRQPTPQWAMASPSGRAVRAVRAIQAPPPAPLPAHQEHYDTEPDSDPGHHLEEDGHETEGYDMMMDMPDQQGLPTPIANAAAPNEGLVSGLRDVARTARSSDGDGPWHLTQTS